MNTSRRNARGEVSLQTILQKTVSLVSSYGYDGTTIARITKSTGRPASSIYWYFETKDELVAAALESTYSFKAGEQPRWPDYTSGTPLYSQLHQALENDFTPKETEAPVRLGIMVALEGIAAHSPVQEPFLSRRSLTRQHVHSWWMNATADHRGSDQDHVAEWMTSLTLAFLDGHYISDVQTEAIPAQGSRLVVKALCNAFHHLLAQSASSGKTRAPGTDSAAGPSPEAAAASASLSPAPDSAHALLASTLSLVAERGYEGATLSRICERSEVQRSSIYWRYKGKDELIHAAVTAPFLRLVATTKLLPTPQGKTWPSCLAANIQNSVEAAAANPNTARAGLLLKLQRRDPAPLGSQAIQQGVREEAAALEAWITSVFQDESGHLNVSDLVWIINILREGLFLGVAFGYKYLADDLTGLILAMVEGVVAVSSPVHATS